MKQLLIFILSLCAFASFAQSSLNVLVKDSASQDPVIGSTVFIKSLKIAASTGADGQATLKDVPDGTHEITISYPGYQAKTFRVSMPAGQTITIILSPDKALDEVVVSATRTNSRLDDSPLKVEVLGNEDMDEENAIKPGNVASILGDVSGIQIQQSSAVSANSNVRIQGLSGKYTQMTRDGLPLYDGFSGGFGVMQIPPLDLKQVEIIKGSASTLFGGGAIGGVINFVSKAPKEEAESIFTINQSTLRETNLNGYYAKRNGKIGISLFSGLTRQQAVDVNGDHFSDVPEVRNFTIHPRLFFYINPKNTLAVGISSTNETRRGGDMTVLQQKPDSIHQFFEQNVTERNTADLLFTSQVAKNTLSIKGSISAFDRNLTTNLYKFDGRQVNGYSEISFLVPRAKNDLVAGANLWADVYTNKQIDTAYLKGYEYYTIGGFVQNTFKYREKLFVEAGLRIDYHTRYGLFVLPRLSGLYKFNTHWYMRAGAGTGYKTPNPLVQQNTEVDLRKVMPSANNVTAEQSLGLNAEVNYKARLGDGGSIQLNQAFFYTGIHNPVISQTDGLGITSLYNEQKPITSQGSDTYIRASYADFELYLGYTYTYARNTFNTAQPFVTLTPLHRAAATLVYEIGGSWRFGLEGSYNGYQYLDDGSKSPDYFFLAAMIEKKLRHMSIVLNGENLLDARQTRYGSIVNAPYTNPTFKPLWGPIDGRIINLSVVFRL